MKFFLLTIITLLILTNSYGQILPSNCAVTPGLYNAYKDDVRALTIERINQINSIYKDSIVVPQNYRDTIWQGLAAINNVTSLSERDSVFNLYCIHQFPGFNTSYQIAVKVDTSYSWTLQWRNLQTITGYNDLDKLITTYGFTIIQFQSLGNYACLNTNQELNIQALCDSLKNLNGIIWATTNNGYAGTGNYITYTSNGLTQNYNFTLGYGDCPSGCTAYYTWKFKVYQGCNVAFDGVVIYNPGNESFPPPSINCNYDVLDHSEEEIYGFIVELFPNPTSTTITISIPLQSTNSELSIMNIQGQLLLKQALTQGKAVVDVSSFSKGMYFIKVSGDRGVAVKKFLKE